MDTQVRESDDDQDDWDDRSIGGVNYIRTNWRRLRPSTQEFLMHQGFDIDGSRDADPKVWDKAADLFYSLGLFEEAVKAQMPVNIGDRTPISFGGNELLHSAATLALMRDWRDPEFATIALLACIKHQTGNAVIGLHYNGGERTGMKTALLKGSIGIAFNVLLAASVGAGLTFAFEHDALTASICAFSAMFSYAVVRTMSAPEIANKWEAARSSWSNLLHVDFHIGTGHGVQQQLQQMLRQGVHVPSVLFDLCALLQDASLGK